MGDEHTNDAGTQDPNTGGDKTSTQNDQDVTLDDSDLQHLDEGTGKKIQTINEQRKRWREKAVDPETGKSYKDLYEEARKQTSQSNTDNQPSKQQSSQNVDEQWQKKVDFLLQNPMSQEEFSVVDAFARSKNLSYSEAYQDQEVKEILNFKKQKKQGEEAVPSPDAGQGGSQQQKSPQEIASMSEEKFREYEEGLKKQRQGSTNA